jgi:hypothetical protein
MRTNERKSVQSEMIGCARARDEPRGRGSGVRRVSRRVLASLARSSVAQAASRKQQAGMGGRGFTRGIHAYRRGIGWSCAVRRGRSWCSDRSPPVGRVVPRR